MPFWWCVWDAPQWGGGGILGDQEFCWRCIDMRHALFEDGVEAFEAVVVCAAEMVRHAAFDLVG